MAHQEVHTEKELWRSVRRTLIHGLFTTSVSRNALKAAAMISRSSEQRSPACATLKTNGLFLESW